MSVATRTPNPEQRAAIDEAGVVFVSAGAGTGKTTVLVERFVKAVCERALPIDSVLVITYTERAAGELRTRIRERLDGPAKLAIALAALGVLVQALALGRLPYVSLVLAFTFAGYGVIRKRIDVEAQTGLLVECMFILPFGLAYALWLQAAGAGHFFDGPTSAALLMTAGPLTVLPLALFAWAARRLPYSTMGFLQFLAPTISFAIGLSQGEPFSALRGLSFVFIWAGAAVFVLGAWRRSRRVAVQSPA